MDITTYALSKKYTDKTVVGLGALKGAPCTIKTIEEIEGGNRITFEWTGNDGTTKNTQTLDVLDGVSVENIEINDDGHLICTMTDGRTIDAGGGGGSSSGTAADITYENENYPDLTNVNLALDELISIVFYVEPKITSFNMTPSTTQYEKGQVVNTLSFSWSINKDIVSQTLSNCTIALDDRTVTYNETFNSNKTFTLTINDGKKSVSSSKKIEFLNKVYWGSAPEGTYNSAFVLALSNNKFATAKKSDYTITVLEGEYGYLAIPKSFGTIDTWNIGGFDVDAQSCGDIDFENASGHTETYTIYRTTQHSLGKITIKVS